MNELKNRELPFVRVYPARSGGVGHGIDPKTKRLLCGRDFWFSVDGDSALNENDCKDCVRVAKVRMKEGGR